MLLGGLLIWGLQPGPLLFVEKPDFVWGLIASMYLGNIAGLLIVLTTVPLLGGDPAHSVLDHRAGHRRDLRDRRVHGPQQRCFDICMMLVFGVVGYLFKKLNYPLAPLVLALVLGDMRRDRVPAVDADVAGRAGIFWSNALVGGIITLALVLLFWPLISRVITALRGKAPPTQPVRADV